MITSIMIMMMMMIIIIIIVIIIMYIGVYIYIYYVCIQVKTCNHYGYIMYISRSFNDLTVGKKKLL